MSVAYAYQENCAAFQAGATPIRAEETASAEHQAATGATKANPEGVIACEASVSSASAAATSAISPNRSSSGAASSPMRQSYPSSNVSAAGSCGSQSVRAERIDQKKSELACVNALTRVGAMICFVRSFPSSPSPPCLTGPNSGVTVAGCALSLGDTIAMPCRYSDSVDIRCCRRPLSRPVGEALPQVFECSHVIPRNYKSLTADGTEGVR